MPPIPLQMTSRDLLNTFKSSSSRIETSLAPVGPAWPSQKGHVRQLWSAKYSCRNTELTPARPITLLAKFVIVVGRRRELDPVARGALSTAVETFGGALDEVERRVASLIAYETASFAAWLAGWPLRAGWVDEKDEREEYPSKI